MKIDEFRNKMCIPADASKDYIMKTFEEIADVLKNECVIKYGKEEYRILDFEFYFFNKNHQDISVHPRNSKALSWYINEFGGIDLNFESNIEKEMVEKGKIWSFKYNLTNNSYYGGILIRQIQKLSGDKKIFDGPLKVAELFRILDATNQCQDNPVLEMKSLDKKAFIKGKRHNLLGSYKNKEDKYKAKADYNIKEWFIKVSESQKREIEDSFASFVESEEYHFCCK
ncbi:MAG: hypothetical protein IJR07_04205 [Bacteroidaceae bacterium]|nr:hypothetical protein [Bacteroidaceae bacterium]